MPSFKLPTKPIQGLRDMSADDIRSALSDVHVPEIKASDLDPRNIDLPKVDLSKIDLSKIDLSGLTGAVSDAATNVVDRTPLRRERPSRWPLVIGGLIVAAIGVIVVRNADWFKARASEVADAIRERTEVDRVDESLEPLEPIGTNGAFAGDVAIPIEPDPYAASLPSAEQELPTATEELVETYGLESREESGIPPR